MKTTVELPNELLARAKSLAAKHPRVTLRELMVAGLEAELDRREAATRIDFAWATADGEGIQVDPGAAIALSYGFSE